MRRRLTSIRHASVARRVPALLFVLCASCCVSQSDSFRQWHIISGTWVLTSIYPTSNVEGPSPSQQRKLLGTSIVLNSRFLDACGQSAPVKSFRASQVSSDDFLSNTPVRFAEVGINTPQITEVVINNREAATCFGVFPLPGQDIYIKNKDELLIYFEGVFYRALRKR
jgi:hypothetical protein